MRADKHQTIFDTGSPGRSEAGYLEAFDRFTPEELPERFHRKTASRLPEVSEFEVVRHYTRLSEKVFGVDHGFYPLGSCTMKYNPKVNEAAASNPGFSRLHPYQPESTVQGALQLIHTLEQWLCELSGMHQATLSPSAGAQGELMGLLTIRAYHESRGENRTKVLIPDSAHGTNPASVTLAGYQAVSVPSTAAGRIDVDALGELIGEDVAAIMITNPNTHGLFEWDVAMVADMVHGAGAQIYCDGANMNALLGSVRFGDLGFDLCHINLHKTFSTPHGGGGPGAGALCVKEHLAAFLPVPRVGLRPAAEDAGGKYYLNYDLPDAIGRMRSHFGNFLNVVRAYCYIRALGGDGLSRAGRAAVLNANYLLARLSATFDAPFGDRCMHEFIVSARALKNETGVRALDIAKGLLDYGFHAPTMYFPLTVEEDLLIEPTESETLATLDAFVEAVQAIVEEARTDSQAVKDAPVTTVVGRLDEATAARKPVLRWHPVSES